MMKNGKSAEQRLWEAAASGDSGTIRALAMTGVDIDARNEDGFTAYNLATQKGYHNTALTILAARQMRYLQRLGAVQEFTQDQKATGAKKIWA